MFKKLATLLVTALVSIPLASPAPSIFWSDPVTSTIYRADLDGLNYSVLIAPVDAASPGALALDTVAGKIYWASFQGFTPGIKRANLDGTGVETFFNGGSKARPGGLAVDRKHLKLYYTDPSDCIPDCGSVRRVNLGGGNEEPLVFGSLPGALALDTKLGAMWWSSDWDGTIYRSDLDGNGKDPVTDSAGSGIALDAAAGKLYWTDADTGAIRRSNLNGSSPEVLLGADVVDASGIALDLDAKKIYWSDPGAGKIQRAKLDGTGVEDLLVGLTSPHDLVVQSDDDESSDDENGDDEADDRPKIRLRTPSTKRHSGVVALQ